LSRVYEIVKRKSPGNGRLEDRELDGEQH